MSVVTGQVSVESLLTQATLHESKGEFAEAITAYGEVVDSDATAIQKCIAYSALYDYYQLLGVEIEVEDLFINIQACKDISKLDVAFSKKKITAKKQLEALNESTLFFDITTGGYSKNTVYESDTVPLITFSKWEPSNAFYFESDVDYIKSVDDVEYSGGGSISAEYSRDYDGDASVDVYAYGRYGIGYKGFELMPSGGLEYSTDSIVYTDNWNYFLDCYVSYQYKVNKHFKSGINIGGEYNDYNGEKAFVAYAPLSFRISFWRLRVTPGIRLFTEQSENQIIYDTTTFNLGAIEEGSAVDLIDSVAYTGEIASVQSQRTVYITVSTYVRPVDWFKFKIYSGVYSGSHLGSDIASVTEIEDEDIYGEYMEEVRHTRGYFRVVFNCYATFYIGSRHQIALYSKYSKSTINTFDGDDIISYEDLYNEYQVLVGSSYSSLKLGLEYTYSL